ncbi:MAG: hypothetical protein Q9M31_07405 [Mariprofundus sp.]|nr:hypothetical protein [Mariprofundus sp.]
MNIGDGWRIHSIPDYHLIGRQYIYGWGWLIYPAIVLLIASVIALMRHAGDVAVWGVYMGFAMIGLGLFLNSSSERKAMALVQAKCLDVEQRYIRSHSEHPSPPWKVRALVEYTFEGTTYQSTPMRYGYTSWSREEQANAFAAQLKQAESLKLYVDRKRPHRTIFYNVRR